MLANIKIKTLIVGVLGVLLAAVLSIGALGLYGTAHTRQLFREVSLRDTKSENTFVQVRLLMETNRSQVLQALQHNPDFGWAKLHDHSLDVHFTAIAQASANIEKLWQQYYSGIESPQEKLLADAWFEKSGGLGVQGVSDAAGAIKRGAWDDAEHLLIAKINPTYRAGGTASAELSKFLAERAANNDVEVERGIDRLRLVLAVAVGLSLLLTIATMMVLIRGITQPLAEAIRIASRVAAGDLGSQIEIRSTNELGDLLRSLKNMSDGLITIVGSVRQSSDNVATGAAEIATGNADLSRRTEQQSSSLQETAAAMEQLTSTVHANAQAAVQAEQLAKRASAVAAQGGATVGQVVATMDEISASSRKISDIIGVIDGIAFQTNILALNAAVEAARAGEQGRGFAVVATEVRNLAQRSAQAAREIKKLIGESVERVQVGSRQVDDAGRTMGDIVAQVQGVSDLIAAISSATHQQSGGIAQVGGAVAQLDEVTQQNAALVEQSSAAAESLQQQARKLVEAVSAFKLQP